MVYLIIYGFQPSKVVQDFATIHSMRKILHKPSLGRREVAIRWSSPSSANGDCASNSAESATLNIDKECSSTEAVRCTGASRLENVHSGREEKTAKKNFEAWLSWQDVLLRKAPTVVHLMSEKPKKRNMSKPSGPRWFVTHEVRFPKGEMAVALWNPYDMNTMAGWFFNPSEKYLLVNWDEYSYSQYVGTWNSCSKPPTNQPNRVL